ncbi:hypothetical protein [Bradyrhizobium sp. AZCC 2230]|uniref:hypothetical protein n=1 Tax=Bradyrhizobium sp. AZCC 2230 TaxID=3117021 RepID=UPI002FEEDD76
MKTQAFGIAVATLFLTVSTLPSRADDTSTAPSSAPAAAPAQAAQPPESVPRPAIVPKTAEPVAPQATTEPAPRAPPRRYVHRHHRRYAYWQPFPVYWPHVYRSHIVWNRIPWFRF